MVFILVFFVAIVGGRYLWSCACYVCANVYCLWRFYLYGRDCIPLVDSEQLAFSESSTVVCVAH